MPEREIQVSVERGSPEVQVAVEPQAPVGVAVAELTLPIVVAEVGVAGAQGAPGLPGEQGPPGPIGPHGFNYTHSQLVPSESWTIAHGLSAYPSVTVIDSGGTTLLADTHYLDDQTLVVQLAAATAGKAYLN